MQVVPVGSGQERLSRQSECADLAPEIFLGDDLQHIVRVAEEEAKELDLTGTDPDSGVRRLQRKSSDIPAAS